MNSLKDERDFGVCLYSGAGGNDPDLTVIKQSLRICSFTTITITPTTKTLEANFMVTMTAARCAGSCTLIEKIPLQIFLLITVIIFTFQPP